MRLVRSPWLRATHEQARMLRLERDPDRVTARNYVPLGLTMTPLQELASAIALPLSGQGRLISSEGTDELNSNDFSAAR